MGVVDKVRSWFIPRRLRRLGFEPYNWKSFFPGTRGAEGRCASDRHPGHIGCLVFQRRGLNGSLYAYCRTCADVTASRLENSHYHDLPYCPGSGYPPTTVRQSLYPGQYLLGECGLCGRRGIIVACSTGRMIKHRVRALAGYQPKMETNPHGR